MIFIHFMLLCQNSPDKAANIDLENFAVDEDLPVIDQN